MKMRTWEVWVPGWQDPGCAPTPPRRLGSADALTFEDACTEFIAKYALRDRADHLAGAVFYPTRAAAEAAEDAQAVPVTYDAIAQKLGLDPT